MAIMISKHSDSNTPTKEGWANGTHDLGRVGGISDDRVDLILSGDSPQSFRSLLKRYSYGTKLNSDITSNDEERIVITHSVPVKPSILQSNTLLSYVISTFAGTRGSYRIRIVPRHRTGDVPGRDLGIVNIALVSASRWPSPGPTQIREVFFEDDFQDELWSGQQLSTNEQSSVLCFELPYYLDKRFVSYDDDVRFQV